MTITKITEMNVVTKVVNILGNEFVLISFEAQNDNQRELYGATIYGLIPYDAIDQNGKLTKVLNGGDMAIDGNPNGCIRRKTFDIKCRQWREQNPNATEIEFIQYAASVMI